MTATKQSLELYRSAYTRRKNVALFEIFNLTNPFPLESFLPKYIENVAGFHTEKLFNFLFKTVWKSDRAVLATQNTLPNAIRNRPYV